MKKDINIPEVKGVYLAAVKVFNESFRIDEWNTYLINNREEALEMALIVSRGFDGSKETSTMRHKLEHLPAKSFAKIEYLQDDVLALTNEFLVTFFTEGKMFEKTFRFERHSIKEKMLKEIPLMPEKGILAE